MKDVSTAWCARSRKGAVLACGLVALASWALGCGSDTQGAGTTGTGGGQSRIECPEAPLATGCTVAVKPSSDDYTAIQTAIGEANAGSTICLCPGTFHVARELDLATERITIRGAGASLEDTIVDFATQKTGDKSLAVTGGGFVIRNLWIKNPPGDGVDVTGVKGVTFQDLKVTWDGGALTTNGAYAVYPVECSDVLIDNVEVSGASDSGIYVGQSTTAIVRNSKVHGCVGGIESENTTDLDVHDNEVFDNTAGILVFTLPNKDKKDALRTHVHDNKIHDNNRENFAPKGMVVAAVPVGSGVVILAADQAEVDHNTITNQDTFGVVVVSGKTFTLLGGGPWNDPKTDPYPEGTYVHANTFTNVGKAPHKPVDAVAPVPFEEVMWDGEEPKSGMAALCLGSKPPFPSFRNIQGVQNLGMPAAQSTDPTKFECDHTTLAPIMF